MDPRIQNAWSLNRRQFFGSTGVSLGTAALASILGQEARGTHAGEALRRLCEWLEAEARASRSL